MTRSLEQALLQGADLSAMQGHSLLINGFHNVSQQYGTTATAVAPSSGAYATDQWQISGAGSWAATFQQVQSPFPSQPDIPNGLKLAITTAEATLGAGDNIQIVQPLEGTNLARLAYGSANAKTVTLAFMIRPSITITGYVGLTIVNSTPAVVRSYAARFTASANTDQFVYLTIPGDTAQSLLTTNALSMQVRWCFGVGATYQGTAGVWSGSNILAGSDVTNLAATVGNNVVISGAVMFPGVIPISQSMLPLLARRYDDELRLCQRYYALVYGNARWSASGGSQVMETPMYAPVQMRVAPSTALVAAGTQFGNASGYPQPVGTSSNTYVRFVLSSNGAGDIGGVGYLYGFNARM
jgi:hypothetical protein